MLVVTAVALPVCRGDTKGPLIFKVQNEPLINGSRSYSKFSSETIVFGTRNRRVYLKGNMETSFSEGQPESCTLALDEGKTVRSGPLSSLASIKMFH